jgi:hypothetical protein
MNPTTKKVLVKSVIAIPGIVAVWMGIAVSSMPHIGSYVALLFWPAGAIWTLAVLFSKSKR